ncbi:MAG: hypothetical protein JSU04_18665 [Bdellovibrionales bacterium]|nr:hypothetical protein [Bdellovibrionales bacterium]
MKQTFFFFTFFVAGVFAHAAPYALVNMGPEFKTFVGQYRNSSSDEKWAGWKAFESKYPVYFDVGLCPASDSGCELKKKTRLDMLFTEMPKFESQMWDLFDRADALTAVQFGRFKNAFPDLQEDTPIVFMPSLLSFNGKGVDLPNGKAALLIGVDFTSMRGHDLDVLFSHEFFHVYQFAKLQGKEKFVTMSSPLWFEGFATWISTYLNPNASEAAVLMNTELADYCVTPGNIKKMAQEYLGLYLVGHDDQKYSDTYKEWFTASGTIQPQRRGYCLGLAVIREVMKTKSLAEVTGLDEKGFNPLVAKALADLAK